MKKPSRLYRKLPEWAKPFCTVQIGDKTYSDDEIMSVTINYGKSSESVALEIPAATVRIKGRLPITYNARMTIRVKAEQDPEDPRNLRFTGRVGAQSLDDSGKQWVTEITAVGTSIKVFRSKEKVYMGVGNSLAYLVSKVRTIAQNRGVQDFRGRSSPAMLNTQDTPRVAKSVTIPDLMGIFEKHTISVLHRRDGSVEFKHPADRANDLHQQKVGMHPIRRSHALAPATHEQSVTYAETRRVVRYYNSGSTAPREGTLNSWYDAFTGETPTDVEYIDLDDFTIDSNLWKYTLISQVYQQVYLYWATKTITTDILMLRHSSDYYQRVLSLMLLGQSEGDFLIFALDWPDDLQGPKTIQGYTETITPDGWKITWSLADPRLVFGYSSTVDGELPGIPIYTWKDARPFSDQGAAPTTYTWANIPTSITWEGARSGF